MNFVEYTNSIINKHKGAQTLIVGAEFNPNNPDVLTVDTELDEWISEYRNDYDDFHLFDLVIVSRVMEHFPIRKLDWYLFQLHSVIKKDGLLYCTVPDMPALAKLMEEEFSKEQPDFFKVSIINHHMFAEGEHVFDRHALWTSEASTKYFLEAEGLFKVIEMNKVDMDSTKMPPNLEFIAKRL